MTAQKPKPAVKRKAAGTVKFSVTLAQHIVEEMDAKAAAAGMKRNSLLQRYVSEGLRRDREEK